MPRAIPLLLTDDVTIVDTADFEALADLPWRKVNGYAAVVQRDRVVYMHRLLTDAPDGMVVDHINRKPLDNRRANLRVCRHKDNLRAKVLAPEHASKTGYRGVYTDGYRPDLPYIAQIGHRKLGRYKTAEDAARAWDAAAREKYGEFARLNFPDDVVAREQNDDVAA